MNNLSTDQSHKCILLEDSLATAVCKRSETHLDQKP